MSALLPETSRKLISPETLRSAAKQSTRLHVVPVRLRRAIQEYLQEQELVHMKNKVRRLSKSFNDIKDFNRLLPESTSKELVEDPLKRSMERDQRWKIKSSYGDIGLYYREDEAVAYVASRMPAVYAACFRVLREIRRRVPDFSPAKVLDFGSGTGSAFWALRELWPSSLERVNLIEPSQSMQRAGIGLVRDMKNMPLVHSYGSIYSLTKDIKKSERKHDLVIASYVLGEVPSLDDRISITRQLWALSRDILVLIEPGTPDGSKIITQMRSHILWMEKRKLRHQKKSSIEAAKCRKKKNLPIEADNDPEASDAFVVAPCPHDGPCPLANSGKYCHFVQRLERTESQRAYKRSNGGPMRGFEDEKFSYVVLRRGKRPIEPWPLDDIKLETLKEMRANKIPEEDELDYEDEFQSDGEEAIPSEAHQSSHDSSATEPDAADELEAGVEVGDITGGADLGTGWGRIIFMPQKRGKRVKMDVCRATKRDGSEGSFEQVIVTRGKNPILHEQARKSIWGDLWPF